MMINTGDLCLLIMLKHWLIMVDRPVGRLITPMMANTQEELRLLFSSDSSQDHGILFDSVLLNWLNQQEYTYTTEHLESSPPTSLM